MQRSPYCIHEYSPFNPEKKTAIIHQCDFTQAESVDKWDGKYVTVLRTYSAFWVSCPERTLQSVIAKLSPHAW